MNNSAVGFPLVPLQKQIETAPHPQWQVADAKIFNLQQLQVELKSLLPF